MAGLVFLGGTAANNPWRDGLIKRLAACGVPLECLFNPVVPDWNEAAQIAEEEAKKAATVMFFCIADPRQEGNPLSAYSMLEVTMELYDRPGVTAVVFDTTGMVGHPLKAMNQALRALKGRFPDANIFSSMQEAENWLVKKLASSV
jgi:hypothetical protein